MGEFPREVRRMGGSSSWADLELNFAPKEAHDISKQYGRLLGNIVKIQLLIYKAGGIT